MRLMTVAISTIMRLDSISTRQICVVKIEYTLVIGSSDGLAILLVLSSGLLLHMKDMRCK